MTVDASGSKAGTGGPIVDYRFSALDQAPAASARAEAQLAQGAAPTVQTQFGWNRAVDTARNQLAIGLGGARSAAAGALGAALPLPVFQRDAAVVTVTVTDASGQTASAQQRLEFAQKTSTQSRTPCGDAAKVAGQKAPAAELAQAALQASSVQLAAACAVGALGGCAGAVIAAAPNPKIADAIAAALQQRDTTKQQISDLQREIDRAQANADRAQQQLQAQQDRLQQVKSQIRQLLDQFAQLNASARAARASAARRKPKRPRATTLGAASFRLAPGAKGTLTVPLGKAARAIVRRHGYLVYRQVVVAVGVSGKQTVKARTVVLKRGRVSR